jgi:hypothetical protein
MAATAMLCRIEDKSNGQFRIVRTAADLQRCSTWRARTQ